MRPSKNPKEQVMKTDDGEMTRKIAGAGLAASLLAGLVFTGCAGAPPRIPPFAMSQRPVAAVMDFDYKASATTFNDSAGGLAESVTDALTKSGRFRLVERSRVQALASEAALGMTGMIDPETAVKAGRMVGANYIIVGSVANVSVRDEWRSLLILEKTTRFADVEAEVRMIDVASGLLVASGRAVGRANGAEKHAFFARAGVIPSAESLVQKALQGLGEKLARDLAAGVEPLK